MNWLEITVKTATEKMDNLIAGLESAGVEGLVIHDEKAIKDFLDNNPHVWDYIENEVFSECRGVSSVQFYLQDSDEGRAQLAAYRTAMPKETFELKQVHDEDWLNNWKKYFKPVEIGQRLLIVPEWETVPLSKERTILRIEPGQAFGTGTHASTSMCLEELEHHRAGKVLDIGCGSGILAVAALLFGAHSAICCDIAPDAACVCRENARLNNIDEHCLTTYTADILSDDTLMQITKQERFDIVFANIVADVIVPLSRHVKRLLRKDGVFICSGIIDGRQYDVRDALINNGLEIISARQTDNWHMLAARTCSDD